MLTGKEKIADLKRFYPSNCLTTLDLHEIGTVYFDEEKKLETEKY